jgi:arsenite methyltransferase
MSLTCPTTLDAQRLRFEISNLYGRVTTEADGDYHFHRGPAYAVEFLDYDASELASLPEGATRSFAGIGNPLKIGRIDARATVVDIGCGAGTDLLLAARQIGRSGKAIGVDMTADMLETARQAAQEAGLVHVELRAGDATSLPVNDSSVDVVISNGVLNLVPEKEEALREIGRILKPGGLVQIADIALDSALSEEARADIDLWTG